MNPGQCTVALLSLGLVSALAACGDSDSSSKSLSSPGDFSGVAQAGAQDFGRFRDLIDDGQIPGPDSIDDLGFFNEHFIGLPAPDCGQDICMHASLGVMGNFISGSNCTMVFMGMNTPLRPEELERPPLDLVIVIDESGSMAGENIRNVRFGMQEMLGHLHEGDRISIVGFSDHARTLVEQVDGQGPALDAAIDDLVAQGSTNIYDGLFEGYSLVGDDRTRQRRLLILSDGLATAGILESERIIALAEGYALEGVSTSAIGLGTEFDVNLMRGIAEVGGGSFYFAEDPAAVREVFGEEVDAFLVPLAEDVQIGMRVDSGYSLRDMLGTRDVVLGVGSASIQIPALQLAHRTSDTDATEGRRGGGGAIIAELIPTDGISRNVGQVTLSYIEPVSGNRLEQVVEIESPLTPGETPEGGYFDDVETEKAFVMLNLFVGFRMATEMCEDGEYGQALATLEALGGGVGQWLAEQPEVDRDIEDDLRYLDRFIDNIRAADEPPLPLNPPEPWPSD